MLQGQCCACRREQPLGTYFYVYQDLLCEPCANARVTALGKQKLKPGDVRRAVDLTLCTECHADGGDRPHMTIGNLPFCPECTARVRKRPFPLWLKAAAVLLLLLLGVATVRMAGYARAAMDLHRSIRLAFVQGDLAGAQQAAAAARKRVPESKYTRSHDNYFTGLKAIYEEDMQQAVSCFNAIDIPLEERVYQRDFLLRSAQISLAFDRRQYDRALALSQENLKTDPGNPDLLTALASVSAACYAQSGDAKRKQETLDALTRAAELMKKAPAAEQARMDYEIKRIRHRLETRQVLSRKEYEQKFGPPPAAASGKEKTQS